MTHRLALSLRGLVAVLALGLPWAASAQTPDSFAPNANDSVFAMAVQPDGKVLIGGDFTMLGCNPTCSGSSTTRNYIARLNADGSIDSTFNPGTDFRVAAILVQGDGKIVVGGSFQNVGGGTGTATPRKYLARFNADGSLDAAFNPGINMNNAVYSLALQADGKILVGGGFYAGLAGGTRYYFGRLNADGTLDTGFSPGVDAPVHSIAVQPDGKILLGGLFTHVGTLDVWDTTRQYIARLNTDGTIDAFNPGADERVDTILVQGDGKILVGGNFTGLGGGTGTTARNKIGRINADGTIDSAFNPGTSGPNDIVLALAEQTDGKILVGGAFTTLAGATRNSIGRLNADGSVDGTFDPGAESQVRALVIQKDGKVLAGGDFEGLGAGTGATARFYAGRLSNTSAATEGLGVGGGGTSVIWSRAGTSSQVWRVEFASSTNGSTYTNLGVGTRVAGGWQLTGLNLQVHPNLTIRARGFYATGAQGASSSIDEIIVAAADFNVVKNADFTNSTSNWSLFATPDMSYIVSNTTGGVFQFYRNAPPAGTTNQAVAFQNTGVAFPTNAAITATFQLGNSSTVRKRVSILLHDSDFSDLSVCTFWLPANLPLTTFGMTTHTTKAWSNLTISFYAATHTSNGGFYLIDDVSVQYAATGSTVQTWCNDPLAPAPPGGGDGAEMLVNGDFASGAVAPGWSLFGNINGSVTGGVFEFNKTTGAAPAGVILQSTAQAVNANQLLTATFQLGNSSGVRKRVTVILHDAAFGDLSACTFWLAAGQALSTYTYRTYATQAWSNATLSVYPATVGPDQWIRLDNVSFKRTPSASIVGTQCFEPGSSPGALEVSPWAVGPVTLPAARRSGSAAAADESTDSVSSRLDAESDEWIADGFVRSDDLAPSGGTTWVAHGSNGLAALELARPIEIGEETARTLRFDSSLSAPDGRAVVQVSVDGVAWNTILEVSATEAWSSVDVSLDAYRGQTIRLRFAIRLEALGTWQVGGVAVGR